MSLFKKEKPGEPIPEEKVPLDAIEHLLLARLENEKMGASEAVDLALTQGLCHGASDIHFEAWPEALALRFRIDGLLYDVARVPKVHHATMIARLKVLAKIELFQKDTPQAGRIDPDGDLIGRSMRASTFPTVDGEQVVLRVSSGGRQGLTLDRLGFHGRIAHGLQEIVARPQGTLLLTGPSSSGKTTTIYAILQGLLGRGKEGSRGPAPHVVTIEDPIEYRLDRVSQTELHPASGYTHQEALRNVLRQDPDVIVIGEIRDAETAQAAAEAGLTGHLVISTVHSGSAAGVFTRLLGMGVEPYLIASSVTGVLSQRLVRRNCAHCNAPYHPDPALVARFGLDAEESVQRGKGCEACEGLGYRGRTAIAEMLTVDEELAELILARSRTHTLQNAAVQSGMMPIVTHGLKKVKRARTTLEELGRVLLAPGTE